MSETTAFANINVNIQTKRKVTINGDENTYIEINPNDLGIISRFGSTIPKLSNLSEEFMSIGTDAESDDSLESVVRVADKFDEVNNKVIELVNSIFDADVCTPIMKGSSMFTITNGEFAFETIISAILTLYSDTIQTETEKLQAKMKKYTSKYIPQDHKSKK